MTDEQRSQPESDHLHKLLCELLEHDKLMARCVLGEDKKVLRDFSKFDRLRGGTTPLIEWMGNLVTLAGALLYSKFNQWRMEVGADRDDEQKPNALFLKRLLEGIQNTDEYFDHASPGLRVLRVLDGLYDSFDMNLSVIKYIIINSQIEAGVNTKKRDSRGLAQLIGFPGSSYDDCFRIVCDPVNVCDPVKKSFSKFGKNLAAAFNFISIYRSDPNPENYYNDEVYPAYDIECAFEDVLCAMKFMKHITLDIDSEGNISFIEDGKEERIPSHGVVRIFGDRTEEDNDKAGVCIHSKEELNLTTKFYFLERMEYLTDPDPTAINAAVSFLYQSFDEKKAVTVCFPEKDWKGWFASEDFDIVEIAREKSAAECYKRISGYLPGTRSISSFFRGMLTTHFRYHNVLAPSIVDAIDEDYDAKVRILEKFVQPDEVTFKEALEATFNTLDNTLEFAPNQFSFSESKWEDKIEKLCEYISSNEYRSRRIIDWDTLMARILIYEGPAEIIKTVLLNEEVPNKIMDIENICNHIIAGMEIRYIDNVYEASDVSKQQQDNYNTHKKSYVNHIKDQFPGEYATKIECKALVQSYIDTIVKTLTQIEEDTKEEEAHSKFAENSIQDALEIFKSYEETKKKSSFNADKAFLQIIKAFLSFYAGIFECCRSRVSYEFDKSATILKPEEIEIRKQRIEAEFFKGVFTKAKELSKFFSIGNAVERALRKLWKFAKMSKDDARCYYAVLARAPINGVKLAKIFMINSNGTIIFKPETKDAVDFKNVVNSDKIIKHLENVIRFLDVGYDPTRDEKTNNEETNSDKLNYPEYKKHAEKVIYPQIVTLAKRRVGCGSNDCLIMDHSGAFAGWHNGEVQILTEFEYKLNHSYYAMPNLNRIETGWWVDPFMMSCYEFDNKIREGSAAADEEGV